MGVFLYWERQNADSQYDVVRIERGTTSSGPWTEIVQRPIEDYTFYDEEGSTNNFYRIRFENTETSNFSGYSDALQTKEAYLYANPFEVAEAAGLSITDLPGNLDMNRIFDIIWDVSQGIDDLRETVYGRKKTFEHTASSRHMNLKRILDIPFKEIDQEEDFKVERRLGDDTWQELKPGYDYEVDYKHGRITFYHEWQHIYRAYNDLRVSGTYGTDTIPNVVGRLAKIISAQGAILQVEGRDQGEAIKSYSQGSVSYTVKDSKYADVMKYLESEVQRINKEAGWSTTKTKMRIA